MSFEKQTAHNLWAETKDVAWDLDKTNILMTAEKWACIRKWLKHKLIPQLQAVHLRTGWICSAEINGKKRRIYISREADGKPIQAFTEKEWKERSSGSD